jgi:hypothetical protein
MKYLVRAGAVALSPLTDGMFTRQYGLAPLLPSRASSCADILLENGQCCERYRWKTTDLKVEDLFIVGSDLYLRPDIDIFPPTHALPCATLKDFITP